MYGLLEKCIFFFKTRFKQCVLLKLTLVFTDDGSRKFFLCVCNFNMLSNKRHTTTAILSMVHSFGL